jgi:hypothetical protein
MPVMEWLEKQLAKKGLSVEKECVSLVPASARTRW